MLIDPAGLSSKSPLVLSEGCTWYSIVPVIDTAAVLALATTKFTFPPPKNVSSGLEVISVEPDTNLNALTPSSSAPDGNPIATVK